MEDILGFVIVIIGLIASAVSSAKKKQAKTTTFPPVTQPQRASTATAPASMASMLPTVSERTVAPVQPTVHTHLEPDCEAHDQAGSLGVKSPEGKDPCHAEQMPARLTVMEEAEPAPGIALDWTSENLVKAVVMQEVLTRPCQRRAAR